MRDQGKQTIPGALMYKPPIRRDFFFFVYLFQSMIVIALPAAISCGAEQN